MPITLTRRLVKGSPLTASEHDTNLDNIESAVDGKAATGDGAAAVATHVGLADPHTQYALESTLGGAALLNVGTGAGTVAAGNDSRLSDARTPTAHASSHATAGGDPLTPAAIGAATAAQGALADSATQPGDLGGAALLNVGTTAGTVAAGNDARFHDSVTLASSISGVLSLSTQQVGGVDAGADRILFWDDSAGATAYLAPSTGLTISGTNLTIDSTVATLTGTQTLENKVLQEVKETVFTITDGAAFEIDPANGPLQAVTLGANRTPAFTNFESGQSVKLKIGGAGFTLTLSSVVWIGQTPGSSGTAPSIGATGFTHIEFWKEGAVLHGSLIGYTAT